MGDPFNAEREAESLVRVVGTRSCLCLDADGEAMHSDEACPDPELWGHVAIGTVDWYGTTNHRSESEAEAAAVRAPIAAALLAAYAAGLDAAAEECEPVRRMYASSGRDAGIASGAVKCKDRIRSLAKKTRGKP